MEASTVFSTGATKRPGETHNAENQAVGGQI